jgi:hypothetical protein
MKRCIACVLCVASVIALCGSVSIASEVAAEAAQPREMRAPHRPAMFVHGRPLGTSSLHVSHRLRDPDVGINGRPWLSQPIMNGHDGPRASDMTCEEPGAWRYGALGDELRTAYVRVNTLTIGISPWQRIEPRGLKHLEAARNKWLADRGYTGGVRTVRNDALHMPQPPMHAPHAAGEGMMIEDGTLQTTAPRTPETIEPRATFRINPEVPRFRKRMQVRSPFGSGNWALAPDQCKTGTVGPSVVTVRGEMSMGGTAAGITKVLPAGTSAASVVAQAKALEKSTAQASNSPAAQDKTPQKATVQEVKAETTPVAQAEQLEMSAKPQG